MWPYGAVFIVLGLLIMAVGLFQQPHSGSGRDPSALAFYGLIGLCFAGAGYRAAARVGRFTVDPTAGRWTLRRGTWPFVETRAGTVRGLEWKMKPTMKPGRRGRPEGFWSLRLTGVPTDSQTLDLPAFDLDRSCVEEETARAAYAEVARQTGIPLDAETGVEETRAHR